MALLSEATHFDQMVAAISSLTALAPRHDAPPYGLIYTWGPRVNGARAPRSCLAPPFWMLRRSYRLVDRGQPPYHDCTLNLTNCVLPAAYRRAG
jgi:hypothetical protein